MKETCVLLSGRANIPLAERLAINLDVRRGTVDLQTFSDGETYVNIRDQIKGKRVCIVQSCSTPANEHFMELLLLIDAAKRLSPKDITVVLPFFPYRRQERKVEKGESLSADLVAKLIAAAGASQIVALNLHSTTIESYFTVPFAHAKAWPVFFEYFKNIANPEHFSVAAPDEGSIHRAKLLAQNLKLPLVIGKKIRPGHDQTRIEGFSGDIAGRNIIILDDEINTAGTMTEAIRELKEAGAGDIYLACVHPVLSGKAIERLKGAPIKKLLVSDSILLSLEKKKQLPFLEIISIASVLAETIRQFKK